MLKTAGLTWLQEKQELEEQRLMLMEEVQSYRNRIKQLEDDLLFRLSNSQARLLTSKHLSFFICRSRADYMLSICSLPPAGLTCFEADAMPVVLLGNLDMPCRGICWMTQS